MRKIIDYFKKLKYRFKAEQSYKHYEKVRDSLAKDTEQDYQKIFLKFNENNFRFLEWKHSGNFYLPEYYLIIKGKKIFYLNYYEKMMPNGEKMLVADKSLTTIN